MGANCTNLSIDVNQLDEAFSVDRIKSKELLLVDTGTRQSPINIDTSKVQTDPAKPVWKPLRIVYPSLMSNLVIQNTGYGWKLDLPDMVAAKTELIGGPLLGHYYRMLQFHCHWGPNVNVGSEHTVNNRSYTAEVLPTRPAFFQKKDNDPNHDPLLHFVHWNTSLYMDPLVAMSKPNGLAVVAVFIDIGYQLNEELEKVLKQIDSVQYKGERKLILEAIDIGKLMPRNRSYWTYQGSLTTPPLFESVTWIIYTTPIFVTIEQIEKFRQIFYTSQMESMYGGRLLENYRHTQPLNNRVVRFVRDRSNDNHQPQALRQQLYQQRIQTQNKQNRMIANNLNNDNRNNGAIFRQSRH